MFPQFIISFLQPKSVSVLPSSYQFSIHFILFLIVAPASLSTVDDGTLTKANLLMLLGMT